MLLLKVKISHSTFRRTLTGLRRSLVTPVQLFAALHNTQMPRGELWRNIRVSSIIAGTWWKRDRFADAVSLLRPLYLPVPENRSLFFLTVFHSAKVVVVFRQDSRNDGLCTHIQRGSSGEAKIKSLHGQVGETGKRVATPRCAALLKSVPELVIPSAA